MEMLKLEAKTRTERGSRKMNGLRDRGLVPAVFYGKGKDSVPLQVEEEPLVRFLRTRHQMLTLSVDGVDAPALLHDVQTHPLTGDVLHLDFVSVRMDATIRVKVKVVLKGVPIGVTANQGVLEQQGHEVEVECLPSAIPDQVIAKVDPLDIGGSLHARELPLPAGVRIAGDPERVIATVHAPKVEEAAEAPASAEAPIQPEVIGAKEREERAAAKAGGQGEKGEKKSEKVGGEGGAKNAKDAKESKK